MNQMARSATWTPRSSIAPPPASEAVVNHVCPGAHSLGPPCESRARMKLGLPIAPLATASLIARSTPPKRRCIATISTRRAFARRIDHLARGRRGRRHRLFDEHVRAGIQRLDCKFAMQTIRREDSDCVGTFAREHLVEIGIDLRTARVVRPKRLRNALGFVGGAALHRDDLRVGDTAQRGNMRALGDRTGARNRDPDHFERPNSRLGGGLIGCAPGVRSNRASTGCTEASRDRPKREDFGHLVGMHLAHARLDFHVEQSRAS